MTALWSCCLLLHDVGTFANLEAPLTLVSLESRMYSNENRVQLINQDLISECENICHKRAQIVDLRISLLR